MRVQEPFTFSVRHVGPGGDLSCRCEAGEILLALEAHAAGEFSVWLRGARLATAAGKARRLRPDERQLVASQLRGWLDTTGRNAWVIES